MLGVYKNDDTAMMRVYRIGECGALGRNVVITGGSGGIGRVVARRFLGDGDSVANLDRTPFPEPHVNLTSIAVEFGEPTSIVAAFVAVDELFKAPADVLVCCAAYSKPGHFLDLALTDLDGMIATNLRGTFLCGQEAGRRMRQKGSGHIVVITSIVAEQAWAGESVYSITKAGQQALVRSMAVELAPFNICVNAVAPGLIDVKSAGMASERGDPEVYNHEMDRTPLGRFGAPEDIAHAIHHLTTVTWMTGQTVTVDGGYLASSMAYYGGRKARLTPPGA